MENSGETGGSGMMPRTEYHFRPSALDKEHRYSLDGNVLVREIDGEAARRIPLAEVRDVHLRFNRTKSRDYYLCYLRLESGSEIALSNRNYRGFNDLEDRGVAYTAFVRTLHEALMPYQQNIRFRVGSTFTFLLSILMTGVMGLILVFSFIFVAWYLIIIVALILWRLVPIIPRTRPMTYAPDSIPPKQLPE